MARTLVRREERYRQCVRCERIEWTAEAFCAEGCEGEMAAMGECPTCKTLVVVAGGQFRAHIRECLFEREDVENVDTD